MRRPETAPTKEDIEQWAAEARLELLRRWSRTESPVDLSDFFESRPYSGDRTALARVVEQMRRDGAAVSPGRAMKSLFSARGVPRGTVLADLMRDIAMKREAAVQAAGGTPPTVPTAELAGDLAAAQVRDVAAEALADALCELATRSTLPAELGHSARRIAERVERARKADIRGLRNQTAEAGRYAHRVGPAGDWLVRILAAARELGL